MWAGALNCNEGKRALKSAPLTCPQWSYQFLSGISDLPALDGPFIHPKAAQRPKLLFVTASSRFRGRQLSPW